jgi:hypothetical protein
MEYFFIVAAMAMTYLLLKMLQLHCFSKYMDKEIKDLFATNRWLTDDLRIDASYKKLNRAMPWNYNFASMIVYNAR